MPDPTRRLPGTCRSQKMLLAPLFFNSIFTATATIRGRWTGFLSTKPFPDTIFSAGIHYYGWTKEEALLYWKTNVPGQEDIAEREITRCINWPVQVLTYKIGAKTILELKDRWQKKDPSRFDIRQFHSWVLERGYLPLGILWEMSQHQ